MYVKIIPIMDFSFLLVDEGAHAQFSVSVGSDDSREPENSVGVDDMFDIFK